MTAEKMEHDTGPAANREEYPGLGNVVVVIPTYNEAENIRQIVTRLRRAVPEVEVLVADDGSPDGTGAIVDEMAAADPRVHALHRTSKEGLGAAYLAGFAWAAEYGADVMVEMDADGSHDPDELPRLLNALRDADVVIGSRKVPGGKIVNWPMSRVMISHIGNLYTRLALSIPVKDSTAGYRAYRSEVIAAMDIGAVASQGYCFQIDMVYRAWKAGYRVREVPVTFAERERGHSKMSSDIVREALWRVGLWGVQARLETAKKAIDKLR
ncbi:polyprenol monophosphomannose synthase [Cryptosporangium sp. NPDC048952]|uniref:polyprenol monophosphomannose synthase n=1 Tax=Cryptosporangium sp. NPDC048952 TaxID=3363961 RepID=UPI003714AF6D